MKLKLFAVLDSKAGFFGNPFVEHREESAMRVFSDAVNDGSNRNNQWFLHPEDFALYEIGEYETETAQIDPVKKLKCLVTAVALKREVKPQVLELPGLKNGVEESPVA